MKVMKAISTLFTSWTRPIILFAFSLVLLISEGLFFDYIAFENLAFWLCVFSVLTILFSMVYQFIKRQFLKSFLTLCVLGIGLVIFFFFSIAEFWKIQSTPDHYADKLTIPRNIQINLPSDSTISVAGLTPNFQLYNSFQPGIYQYTLWIKNIEKGYCYLKAFEVTQNDPLSTDRLKEQSKIEVFNPSDSVKIFDMGKDKYNSERDFTIYEGDWGKPYAARFEVWFVPANGGQERKLMEKNFKIEGWMR